MIKESDLVVPALQLADAQPSGYISTEDLIAGLTALFPPTGHDADIIPSRQDTYFSQKVRNLISHKDQPGSFIANGYAEHNNGGLVITPLGRSHLRSLGL